MQWSPWSLLTVGMAVDQSILLNSNFQGDVSFHNTDNSTGTPSLSTLMNRTNSAEKRKFPLHLAWGVSYFPTPSLLYTADLDYYQASENGRADIMNYSGGTEYYLNPTNAIRFGCSPTTQTFLCRIHQQLLRTNILISMVQALATLLTRPLLLSH